MLKSKVYFTPEITPEKVVEIYEALGRNLTGNVAVKLHSGEKGNQNFLKPDFWAPIIDEVDGTVVECNTAYEGARNTTEKHLELIKEHGWEENFLVDILDSDKPDMELTLKCGKVLKKDFVGRHLYIYDSMLVCSHFKGHPMAGFGGALKQLSIGCASANGKAYIHSGGKQMTTEGLWDNLCNQDTFLEAMADAASSVYLLFYQKLAFINVMKNMSVDCDCCAVAEDPCLKDMGIMASLDPVAVDQACLDMIYASDDPGKEHFIERVESRNGQHVLEAAAALKLGNREYELVRI